MIVASITAIAALGSWVLTFFQARSQNTDVNDIADNSFIDPSAVQISQLVDQAMLDLAPYFAASLGLTAAFLAACGLGILQRQQ